MNLSKCLFGKFGFQKEAALDNKLLANKQTMNANMMKSSLTTIAPMVLNFILCKVFLLKIE